jgi:hypothetical protein
MMDGAVHRWKRDQELADLRAARICSILTSSEKHKHPPKEFMIDYDAKPEKEPKRQTPEQMAAILKSLTLQCGGEVIDGV